MGKRKRSIGVDLAPTPRKKARGRKRMAEILRADPRGNPHRAAGPGRAFVYAIEARGTGFIKIGVARDVKDRLSSLQTSNPYDLAFLYGIETDEDAAYKIEAAIHKTPEARNSRGRGEWVDVSPKIIPTLFAFAADAVGAEIVWRFGAPADEEIEGVKPRKDRLARAMAGFALGRRSA